MILGGGPDVCLQPDDHESINPLQRANTRDINIEDIEKMIYYRIEREV